MRHDARFEHLELLARPIHRRTWVRWVLGLSMFWPIVLALALTISGASADWTLLAVTFLNISNGFGLSPFARTPLFLPGRGRYDEFEAAALGVATARAHALIAALLIVLTLAAAWAGQMGFPVAPHPRTWLLWALALTSLFTTLPALFAEISIPLPQEDAA